MSEVFWAMYQAGEISLETYIEICRQSGWEL